MINTKRLTNETKRLELIRGLTPHYPGAAVALTAWLVARVGTNSNPAFYDKAEEALAMFGAMPLEEQLIALNGKAVVTTVKVVPLKGVEETAAPEPRPQEPKTLLDWALDACRRGYAVHPLQPRSKQPATPRGYYDATTDEEQIRKYWKADPECNPSIWPGKTGRTVLDIDHGLSSLEDLHAWLERNHLPRTFAVRTGRRPGFGVQLHFDEATEYNGTWALDGCSGEVRSLGGYAVAPGAIHPDSGERYEIVEDRPRASLPDVFKNLEERKGAAAVPPLAAGEKVKTGQRDNWLTSQAGRLWNIGIHGDQLLASLRQLNREHCDPPKPDEDVRRIAGSAEKNFEREKPTPRVVIGAAKAEGDLLPPDAPLEERAKYPEFPRGCLVEPLARIIDAWPGPPQFLYAALLTAFGSLAGPKFLTGVFHSRRMAGCRRS